MCVGVLKTVFDHVNKVLFAVPCNLLEVEFSASFARPFSSTSSLLPDVSFPSSVLKMFHWFLLYMCTWPEVMQNYRTTLFFTTFHEHHAFLLPHAQKVKSKVSGNDMGGSWKAPNQVGSYSFSLNREITFRFKFVPHIQTSCPFWQYRTHLSTFRSWYLPVANFSCEQYKLNRNLWSWCPRQNRPAITVTEGVWNTAERQPFGNGARPGIPTYLD